MIMEQPYEAHTIYGVSTPPGRGGIGIIRVSGPDVTPLLSRLCPGLLPMVPRKLYYTAMRDRDGQALDDGMAVFFPGPHSYTGEDMAELHCHGNPSLLDWIMAEIASFLPNSRPAQPGEFTKRAYLNGKMDLLSAEAVMDIISATGKRALSLSLRQLDGAMGKELVPIIGLVRDAVAGLEAAIDYPEEEWEEEATIAAIDGLRQAYGLLEDLAATYRKGRLLMEGIRCAMVGRPNAGKSSLLNAIAGFERAIVDVEEGTTRDVLEHPFLFRGQTIYLVDTAGRRQDATGPEATGLRLGEQAIRDSDVALLVVDGSRPLSEEDKEAATLVRSKNTIIVRNKTDLPLLLSEEEVQALLPRAQVVSISAKEGIGLEALFSLVLAEAGAAEGEEGALLTNARQRDCVIRARDGVLKALSAFDQGIAYDMVSMDAMDALSALMELTGENARESVINTIFQKFCVGK